jgi:nucleotide-binding universal stress UspA family protein
MRFLIGVDLNAPGHEWLVDRAARFAWRAKGRIDLLFVASSAERDARDEARLMALFDRVIPETRGQVRREAGDPVETLIHATSEYDAIVVGPREPGGLERLLKGTIAMRILRGANSAVLVPRGEASYSRQPRVLVGLDLGGEPEGLFQGAAHWARALGTTLDAVYVDPMAVPEGGAARQEVDVARAPLLARLQALINGLEPSLRGAPRIAEGDPESALVDLSSEYDVLVLGTLGKAGVFGSVRASVAENLVRSAKCDVLTVPTHH